jgi:very-short-patch-repair endonuclease
MSRSRKGRKIKKAEKIKTSELCAFGCGKTAKYKLRSGKLCCSKSWNSCLILRLKNSRSLKGTIPWNLGLNKNNNEIMKKMSNDKINITFNQKFGKEKSLEISLNKRISMMRKPSPMKGRNHTDEVKKRIGLKSKEWWENHPEEKEKLKQKMLDGMSVYMQMFITNPSIPEIKLRNMVMLLIPDVLSSYPIYRGKGKRNYVVDMAILKYKLIIEYDGWYHFDSQESKDRDIIRQKNIEELGWRFLRYNMFSKLPTIENLKEDIEKIIGEKLANFKHVVG